MPNDTTERPILFSGEMVRAILDGRKTQTRRVIKRQPIDVLPIKVLNQLTTLSLSPNYGRVIKCRFGVPGDHLWVRESWHKDDDDPEPFYRATEEHPEIFKWKPSIHMPRWASRITLEITDVKAERLQDISEKDSKLEGVSYQYPGQSKATWRDYQLKTLDGCRTAKESFKTLWDSIYAKRGYGWDVDPWVWAITFKVVE